MALRFAFLGSGSRGNAALIEADGTCVMLDCGFSVIETEKRLARLERDPEDIDALLITHEHGDHVGGAVAFAVRHDIELWMTPGTRAVVRGAERARLRTVNCHERFAIGDVLIEPTPVPHDAREPCQYVFGDGRHRLGILTDLGHVSRHVTRTFDGCDALALECNHDPAMLDGGPYPRTLKRRIGGDFGHLSNAQASGLLNDLDLGRLQHLVAVHVSDTNNTGVLARDALAASVNGAAGDIEVVDQDAGLDWRICR